MQRNVVPSSLPLITATVGKIVKVNRSLTCKTLEISTKQHCFICEISNYHLFLASEQLYLCVIVPLSSHSHLPWLMLLYCIAAYRLTHVPLTHSSLRLKTSNALCSTEESDLCRFVEIGFTAWTHDRELARRCD